MNIKKYLVKIFFYRNGLYLDTYLFPWNIDSELTPITIFIEPQAITEKMMVKEGFVLSKIGTWTLS